MKMSCPSNENGLRLLLSCQSRPLVPEHGSQSVRNESWFLSSGIIHTNVSQLSQEKQFQLEQCTIHFSLAEKKGKGACYYSDFYMFFANTQTLRWCVERWNLKIKIKGINHKAQVYSHTGSMETAHSHHFLMGQTRLQRSKLGWI